jgi:glycosyltransferase involved in cell wall biosynthesis
MKTKEDNTIIDKVSVIIATLNGDEGLIMAIDSVLNQTYPNIEIIVCNDASKSVKTIELLNSYLNDDKIRLLSNETNMGAAYSRNKCILESSSELIVLMDDDDYSPSHRVETLVRAIKEYPDVGFVGSFATIKGDDYVGILSPPLNPSIIDVFKSRAFVHASILIRKSAFEKVGNYSTTKETNRLEDYDLFCKLYEKGIKGVNIPEDLYLINESNSWISRRNFNSRFREFRLRLYWFNRFKLSYLMFPIVIKPLLIAIFPKRVYVFLRGLRYSRNKE